MSSTEEEEDDPPTEESEEEEDGDVKEEDEEEEAVPSSSKKRRKVNRKVRWSEEEDRILLAALQQNTDDTQDDAFDEVEEKLAGRTLASIRMRWDKLCRGVEDPEFNHPERSWIEAIRDRIHGNPGPQTGSRRGAKSTFDSSSSSSAAVVAKSSRSAPKTPRQPRSQQKPPKVAVSDISDDDADKEEGDASRLRWSAKEDDALLQAIEDFYRREPRENQSLTDYLHAGLRIPNRSGNSVAARWMALRSKKDKFPDAKRVRIEKVTDLMNESLMASNQGRSKLRRVSSSPAASKKAVAPSSSSSSSRGKKETAVSASASPKRRRKSSESEAPKASSSVKKPTKVASSSSSSAAAAGTAAIPVAIRTAVPRALPASGRISPFPLAQKTVPISSVKPSDKAPKWTKALEMLLDMSNDAECSTQDLFASLATLLDQYSLEHHSDEDLCRRIEGARSALAASRHLNETSVRNVVKRALETRELSATLRSLDFQLKILQTVLLEES